MAASSPPSDPSPSITLAKSRVVTLAPIGTDVCIITMCPLPSLLLRGQPPTSLWVAYLVAREHGVYRMDLLNPTPHSENLIAGWPSEISSQREDAESPDGPALQARFCTPQCLLWDDTHDCLLIGERGIRSRFTAPSSVASCGHLAVQLGRGIYFVPTGLALTTSLRTGEATPTTTVNADIVGFELSQLALSADGRVLLATDLIGSPVLRVDIDAAGDMVKTTLAVPVAISKPTSVVFTARTDVAYFRNAVGGGVIPAPYHANENLFSVSLVAPTLILTYLAKGGELQVKPSVAPDLDGVLAAAVLCTTNGGTVVPLANNGAITLTSAAAETLAFTGVRPTVDMVCSSSSFTGRDSARFIGSVNTFLPLTSVVTKPNVYSNVENSITIASAAPWSSAATIEIKCQCTDCTLTATPFIVFPGAGSFEFGRSVTLPSGSSSLAVNFTTVQLDNDEITCSFAMIESTDSLAPTEDLVFSVKSPTATEVDASSSSSTAADSESAASSTGAVPSSTAEVRNLSSSSSTANSNIGSGSGSSTGASRSSSSSTGTKDLDDGTSASTRTALASGGTAAVTLLLALAAAFAVGA